MANERVLRPASDRAQRVNRVPVSGQRDILTVKHEKDPNFVERIVNDKPGRIDKFLAAGYEIVTTPTEIGDPRVGTPTPEGSPVKISVGRGQQAYLMRQPKEFYEEDQKAKESEIKAREESMKDAKSDGRYGKVEIFKGSQT